MIGITGTYGEDSEAEKRDILLEFIQNMAPDDKAIIFIGKKAKVTIIFSSKIILFTLIWMIK